MPNLPFRGPAESQHFELIKSVLENADLSESDKAYVLSGTWTMDQVPEIKSDAEYRRYVKLHRTLLAKLNAELPPRSDPQYGEKFVAQVRTPEGLLETAIGARMIEWEDWQEQRRKGF